MGDLELRSKQAFRTSLPLILRTRLRLAYGGLLRRCYNPCRMYQKHFKYIFIIYINKTHKVNKIMLRNTKISWQTHYKMISCNIWLPVVIHRSKTRNNALDVFWGIETIIMPLSRQPQKKSFCPVSHSLAPTFMKIFFIMRLPCCTCFLLKHQCSFCLHVLRVFFNASLKNSEEVLFKSRSVPVFFLTSGVLGGKSELFL